MITKTITINLLTYSHCNVALTWLTHSHFDITLTWLTHSHCDSTLTLLTYGWICPSLSTPIIHTGPIHIVTLLIIITVAHPCTLLTITTMLAN